MRTLVLGGTQFVGRRLVEALLAAGHEVTALNRGTRSPVPGSASLRADRHTKGDVGTALAGRQFDAAFDVSAYKPEETAEVVQALAGRVGRFVHISTGAVYSAEAAMPWMEDSPRRSTEPASYGSDKARCEDVLFAAHAARGFPAVVLRPSYVYGPCNHLYREAYFYDRAEAGRPILVPAGGRKVQFVHVDDLAAATILAAERAGVAGETFNVAGDEAVTFDLLARLATGAAGVEPDVVAAPASPALAALFPFADFDIAMSAGKVRARLDATFRPLAQGLRDAYQWYRGARPFGAPDFARDEEILARASRQPGSPRRLPAEREER